MTTPENKTEAFFSFIDRLGIRDQVTKVLPISPDFDDDTNVMLAAAIFNTEQSVATQLDGIEKKYLAILEVQLRQLGGVAKETRAAVGSVAEGQSAAPTAVRVVEETPLQRDVRAVDSLKLVLEAFDRYFNGEDEEMRIDDGRRGNAIREHFNLVESLPFVLVNEDDSVNYDVTKAALTAKNRPEIGGEFKGLRVLHVNQVLTYERNLITESERDDNNDGHGDVTKALNKNPDTKILFAFFVDRCPDLIGRTTDDRVDFARNLLTLKDPLNPDSHKGSAVKRAVKNFNRNFRDDFKKETLRRKMYYFKKPVPSSLQPHTPSHPRAPESSESVAKLVKVFASLLWNPDEAKMVARHAGFPRNVMPAFRNSTLFWEAIFEKVNNGIGGGCNVHRLVDEALSLYKGNDDLNAWKRQNRS